LLFTLLTVLAAGALAGCDDHVIVDRDTSIPIRKGMTWAWRPSGSPPPSNRSYRDPPDRPPAGYAPTYKPNANWENDIVRNRIARAFEQALNSRGLVQVSDPNKADFLADYQFAVQQHRERVATPLYAPGLVCGYYGCWSGFYGPPSVYLHSVQYHEGTIVFDLFDHHLNRLAYRGIRETPCRSCSRR
jgi:Domain of unknown function (DUF4136)